MSIEKESLIPLSRTKEDEKKYQEKVFDKAKEVFGSEYVFRGDAFIQIFADSGQNSKGQSRHGLQPSCALIELKTDQYSNYYVVPVDPHNLLALAYDILEKFEPRRPKRD